MKKKIVTALAIIATMNAYGQSNTFPLTGKVGIGTTNPVSDLHVNGTTTTGLLTFSEGATEVGYFGRGLSTTGAWNQTPDILALTYYGRDFAIGGWSKSSTNWMGASLFINSDNSNVGIGTINPIQKLDVNGGINATGYYLKNSGTSDYPGSYLHRLRAEDGNFYIDGDIGGSTYAPAVTVHRSGNVGIGTTDTRGFKLAVNGNIRAKEVKVETTNWPDYVFEKDYQLPTLQETENHIKEKGYLPGMPSAAEVKANGIDLGEMNVKLLQKIEELTLYLIEMKKESAQERERNENQQKLLYQQQSDIKYLKSKLN